LNYEKRHKRNVAVERNDYLSTLSCFWHGYCSNHHHRRNLKSVILIMKDIDIKKTLTRILFLQNVAGARNVSYLTRLEALHEDVACVVTGEEPTSSQRVVENTRLPDRC